MIPGGWQPIRRAGDGELVGYLAPPQGASSANGGLVVPTTLIGTALGPPQPSEYAVSVLTARGLAVLAHRWWCRLPRPLISEDVDAADPRPEWDWRPVVLVEVSPAGARIRIAMPALEELTVQVALPVPVNGLLVADPPE